MNKDYTIILDTNILGTYKGGNLCVSNFKYLEINKNIFNSLIRFINKNKILSNVKIAIPKIALEEIKKQQSWIFDQKKEKLNKLIDELKTITENTTNINDINYPEYLSEKIEAFVGKYDLIVLEYPSDSCLQRLIDKVMNHKKPFYKKGNDGGFKDALIWESILEYAKENSDREYILFTNDPDFDESLIQEFTEETGSSIKIIHNLAEIKNIFDKEISLKLNFGLITEEYKNKLKKIIENKIYQKYHRIMLEGELFDINKIIISNELYDLEIDDEKNYHLTLSAVILYSGYTYDLDPYKGNYDYIIKDDKESELFEITIRKEGDFYNILEIDSLINDLK